MKAKRRYRAFPALFVLVLAMTLIGVVPSGAAAADPSCTPHFQLTGTAVVEKSSVASDETVRITYTLTPSGSPPPPRPSRQPADIALVLDVSGSMNYGVYNQRPQTGEDTRLLALKKASKRLLDKIQAANAGDRVGLIKFSTTASVESQLTTNYGDIRNKINNFYANGYTNIDHGLTLAEEMLRNSPQNRMRVAILLTDGYANYYTDNKDGKAKYDESKARQEALADADSMKNRNIVVYTIALAQPGSQEVDLNLLQQIAQKTGGKMYQAGDTSELESVFEAITEEIQSNGTITSTVVRQPLPNGFSLSGDNPSTVRLENGVVVIDVLGSFVYPFGPGSEKTVTVSLTPPPGSGNYTLTDAVVRYLDDCGQVREVNIKLGASVQVYVRAVDRYGNTYVGEADGTVTRYRAGDGAAQWRIPASGTGGVRDIWFEDADPGDGIADDTIVAVRYHNGDVKRWTLTPTAPSLQLTDGAGGQILSSGWHLGPGKVTAISGSAGRLPPETQYLNEDFRANYIAGYQYRINGGVWTNWMPGRPVALPDGSVTVEARAVTNAIAGFPIGGNAYRQTVLLDSTPPQVAFQFDIPKPADDGRITVVATEDSSPVTRIRVWLDDASSPSLVVDASGIQQNGNVYTASFRLSDVYPDASARWGWHRIRVEATSTGGSAQAGPGLFVVNPGPQGSLVALDPSSPGSPSDKPVLVEVRTSHPVTPRFNQPGFRVVEMYYAVSTQSDAARLQPGDWHKLNALKFRVTTAPGQTRGTYYVFLRLVDDDGVTITLPTPLRVDLDYNQKRY